MSKLVHGLGAKDMPVQVISKNLNNASAHTCVCKCGRMLGSLGQFKLDKNGRRLIRCEDLTPEKTAELVRSMGLIIHPTLSRQTKGCGTFTAYSATGQVEHVVEKGTPLYNQLVDALEKERKLKAAEMEAETFYQNALKAQMKGDVGGGRSR